jgi:leucyl/phenylalanyl-tRNA--protein transferase
MTIANQEYGNVNAPSRIPVEILLAAYRAGWFPMGNEVGEVEWYSPDPRGILPLDAFHAARRLERVIRRGQFEVHVDRAFSETIQACAERGETWITPVIIDSYCELHQRGFAHSVETWRGGRLVGGLYGVSLGGAFFGESMFHRVTDASKVALAGLVERLRTRGFRLLDIQWVTPHLAGFGAIEVSRREYLRLLRDSQQIECQFA